jgi:hypothetical protein
VRPRLSDDDVVLVRQLYAGGLGPTVIAEKFERPVGTIEGICAYRSRVLPQRARRVRKVIPQRRISPEEAARMCELRAAGLSYPVIARRLNVAVSCAFKYARGTIPNLEDKIT